MANPLQRAVVRRQATYLAIIIALLTFSLFLRGKISLTTVMGDDVLASADRVTALLQARRADDYSAVPPPSSPLHRVTDTLASRTILDQASRDSLDLREVDQGDAQVDAAFARLMLTGSRGLVVTVLWQFAHRYQMRNEYHKLEQTVNAVTQLQPNFTMPWLYQSWNISYNVSVENDRMSDMYYFIARGIELLAKGERLNRNSPDMRYYIAFYYQNKFSVSDKVTTLRSQMQLSCIKPSERNPDRFRDPVTKRMSPAQMQEFRKFMRANPQLTRRLHDFYVKQRERKQPVEMMDLVRFLEENQRVPTRYDKDRQDILLPASEQFPILPPAFDEGPEEKNPNIEILDDTFDAFLAARAWFLYANTALPPPEPEPEGSRVLTAKELFKYRIPRSPMMIIFRQGAMRAQTYLAERLQKEGWFDGDTRWTPEDWLEGEDLASGTSSLDAWRKAFNMWSLHGEMNGLKYDPQKLAMWGELAAAIPSDDRLSSLSDEQLKALGIRREQIRARNILRIYQLNRTHTNYAFFLNSTEAEADPMTVRARQKLFDAEESRQAGRDAEAIDRYVKALSAWRQVLLRYEDFSRSDKPEEDTYEAQMNLVRLLETRPEIMKEGRAVHEAIKAIVPFAADGTGQFPLSADIARDIAEHESNLRVAMYDPRIQTRVDQLSSTSNRDSSLSKDWPVVIQWQQSFAKAAFRNANPAASPSEADKAADSPEWRAKGVAMILDKGADNRDAARAREAIARQVIIKEYEWLPEYRKPFKDDENRWVREASMKVVRDRLGLVRPKPVTGQTVELH